MVPALFFVRSRMANTVQYTFLAFLSVFEVGSAVCGSAQSSKALIAGRVVAGFGASGIMNGALTIVSASAPRDKQPRAFLLYLVFPFSIA